VGLKGKGRKDTFGRKARGQLVQVTIHSNAMCNKSRTI